MSIADFDALTADIRANGLKDKIVLLDGKILDGWHRYRALKHLDMPIDSNSREFPADKDPVAFVLSKNFFRRHMDASQRAVSITTCHAWQPHGVKKTANESDKSESSKPKTNAELAKIADVSPATITHAKTVIKAGRQDEVLNGHATVRSIARPAPPKPAPKEPEPENEETNWEKEFNEAHKEITRLEGVIESLKKNDLAKELEIQHGKFKALSGRNHQLNVTNAELEKLCKYRGGLLERVRKLLNVEKDREIMSAIEALQ